MGVVRFLFRALSFMALLLAVITATMDSIQSVSSSEVILTSLGSAWDQLDALSLERARELLESHVRQPLVLSAVDWVLRQPTFGVFLALWLAFWMIGYRKPNPAGRFAA